MRNGIASVPKAVNEPIKDYAPGSPERASLKQMLEELKSQTVEIPLIIGGKEVRTGNLVHSNNILLSMVSPASTSKVASKTWFCQWISTR